MKSGETVEGAHVFHFDQERTAAELRHIAKRVEAGEVTSIAVAATLATGHVLATHSVSADDPWSVLGAIEFVKSRIMRRIHPEDTNR